MSKRQEIRQWKKMPSGDAWRNTRSGVAAGKLLGRQDMVNKKMWHFTFVTIGLNIHDGVCRKLSADFPVRDQCDHRVSSLILGVQLTVPVSHQLCSWSVSGDSSGTIADFPPICADCGVKYSEAQPASPAPPRDKIGLADSRRIIWSSIVRISWQSLGFNDLNAVIIAAGGYLQIFAVICIVCCSQQAAKWKKLVQFFSHFVWLLCWSWAWASSSCIFCWSWNNATLARLHYTPLALLPSLIFCSLAQRQH